MQASLILIIIGFFLFIAFGISAANSIEAHESEKTENVFCVISLVGLLCAILGSILLLIDYLCK